MWMKIKLMAASAIALAIGVYYALSRSRQDGIRINEAEQMERRHELRDGYDKIDSERPDAGAAYDGLRARSQNKGRGG